MGRMDELVMLLVATILCMSGRMNVIDGIKATHHDHHLVQRESIDHGGKCKNITMTPFLRELTAKIFFW
jgi:hypothetical protein